MKRLPFVLWMVLAPLTASLDRYLYFVHVRPVLVDFPPSLIAYAVGLTVNMAVYVWIAVRLWNDDNR